MAGFETAPDGRPAAGRLPGWRLGSAALALFACAVPLWYFGVPYLSYSGHGPLVLGGCLAALGLAGVAAAFVHATRRWRIFAHLSGQDLVIRSAWSTTRIPLDGILSTERNGDRVIVTHTDGRVVVDEAYFQDQDEAEAFSRELTERIARRPARAARVAKSSTRKVLFFALLTLLSAELAGVACLNRWETQRRERLLPLQLRAFLSSALDVWSMENPKADIAWADGGFLTPEIVRDTLKAPEILGLCERNFAIRPRRKKEAPAFSNLRLLGYGSYDSAGIRYLDFAIVVGHNRVIFLHGGSPGTLADFRQRIAEKLKEGSITPALARTHLDYIASLEDETGGR